MTPGAGTISWMYIDVISWTSIVRDILTNYKLFDQLVKTKWKKKHGLERSQSVASKTINKYTSI